MRALPLLVGVLAALPFLGVIPGSELLGFDDHQNLVENEAWRGLGREQLGWMLTSFHFGHYHPLTWLSFAVDHALFGMDPRGFHATNIALHALAAALVYTVLREVLTRADRGSPAADPRERERSTALWAAFGALFFAVHPLRAESVAWITERRDVLSGAFWLLTVLAWLRAHPAEGPTRRGWYAVSVGALALSLLAKAWGITLPVVLLLLDVYPLRRLRDPREVRTLGRLVVEKVPHLALALGTAFLAQAAQREVGAAVGLDQYALEHRLSQAVYGLVHYPWKTLWPSDLCALVAIQDVDWSHWRFPLAGVVGVAITVGAVLVRRRWPSVLAAWVFYGIVVSPVLGLFQSGPQLVADRYSYLSTLSFAALLAGGARELARRVPSARRALPVLAAAVLLLLGVRAHAQALTWRTNLSLWDRVLEVYPDGTVARFNHASALYEAGRFEEAIADYRATVRAQPDEARGWNGLALGLYADGRWSDALAAWARAAALAPHGAETLELRARAAREAGELERAARLCEEALALAPRSVSSLLLRAQLHVQAGELEAARERLYEVLRIAPDNAQARQGLAAL